MYFPKNQQRELREEASSLQRPQTGASALLISICFSRFDTKHITKDPSLKLQVDFCSSADQRRHPTLGTGFPGGSWAARRRAAAPLLHASESRPSARAWNREEWDPWSPQWRDMAAMTRHQVTRWLLRKAAIPVDMFSWTNLNRARRGRLSPAWEG